MANKNGLNYYLRSTSDIFEDVYQFENNKLLESVNNILLKIENSNLSKLNQMLYSDFIFLLRSDLLVKMDIATMANSLEARSPFLSKDMMETAPRLSDNFKINRFQNKFILRYLSKKYLSKNNSDAKRGFEVPLINWIDNTLKEPVKDSLNKNSYCSSLLGWSFIRSLFEKKLNVSSIKRAKMIWSMYCLETWFANKNIIKNEIFNNS